MDVPIELLQRIRKYFEPAPMMFSQQEEDDFLSRKKSVRISIIDHLDLLLGPTPEPGERTMELPR